MLLFECVPHKISVLNPLLQGDGLKAQRDEIEGDPVVRVEPPR